MLPAAASLAIVALASGHDTEAFDCGEPARNTWLRTRAAKNDQSGDSRTYVAVDGAITAGFYALTVGSILREILPGALRRNAPDPVSCVLLAQLAMDTRYQRRGLARTLVLHGMRQSARIADLAGCRLFAVSPARPELVTFYGKFGFREVATQPPLMANAHPPGAGHAHGAGTGPAGAAAIGLIADPFGEMGHHQHVQQGHRGLVHHRVAVRLQGRSTAPSGRQAAASSGSAGGTGCRRPPPPPGQRRRSASRCSGAARWRSAPSAGSWAAGARR